MRVHGSCHCAAIGFEADIDPAAAMVCHCTDCRVMSGSAFRVVVPAPAASFVLNGTPRVYIKTAASGARRAQFFCADCGTHLYAGAPPPQASAFYSVRAGVLKEFDQVRPTAQLWQRSSVPWVYDLASVAGCQQQEILAQK
jgi:hypothetical protein